MTEPKGTYRANNVRNVETAFNGYTICPDVLVDKYSHTTAIIFGKIWRYCQMADGVCNASIFRLADELGLSQNTLLQNIAKLEDGGYIKDLTPDLRNKPHSYVDTGKLKMKFSSFMQESPISTTQILSSHYSKFELEESTTKGNSEKPNIFRVYEENIGALTPIIAEILKIAEKDYGSDWIVDAITLAVKNKKRNWRYCETILARWREEGKDDGEGKPAPKEVKRPTVEFVDGVAVLK